MYAKNLKCAAAIVLFLTAVVSHADTIIEDTFTAADNTSIDGRTPLPTDLPCGTWYRDNLYYGLTIQGNVFVIGPDVGGTLSLGSTNGYTRPNKLTISGDLKVNTLNNGSGNGGGISLGFNSIAGGSYSSYTGLRLDQAGRLYYRQSGVEVASVAWSGPTFSNTAFYHLSYEVDTGSGDLSNIQLQNSLADYSPLVSAAAGNITLARATYAAFVANSGNGGDIGYLDNFKVMATAPDIKISKFTVAENLPSGTAVGSFSMLNTNGTFTYALTNGIGDAGNALFQIAGGSNLLTKAAFDYEATNSYSILVRGTEQGGGWAEKVFTILVTNVVEALTITTPATTNIYEGMTAVCTVHANGDNPPMNYSISGGTDSNLFNLVSGSGVLTLKDPAAKGGVSYYVQVQATDNILSSVQLLIEVRILTPRGTVITVR